MILPTGPYTIAFEGIDGVGKTTQAELLADQIRATGQDVLLTHQPGGSDALNVRKILLGSEDLCPKARHLLFAADNAQHIHDTVRPALEEGKVVIMDRGIGSAYAYQGFGEGFGIERVETNYGWATDNFEPNLTLLLDMTVADALGRLAGEKDAIESKGTEFFDSVRLGYHACLRRPSWRLVPLSGVTPVDVVTDMITAVVSSHWRHNG